MISIIIPIWNIKKEYLRKCIDSIVLQEYSDVEILLIDNASDAEYAVGYKDIASADDRIKLLYQDKKGVSHARNKGLEASRGDWIMFVDGDDWLEESCLDTFNALCEEHKDSDVIVGRNLYCKEDEVWKNFYWGKEVEEIENENRNDILDAIFEGQSEKFSSISMPWGKVYRRDFLIENNIKFCPLVEIGEDGLFNFEVFFKCKKAVFVDEVVYCYRKSTESASEKVRENMPDIVLKLFDEYKLLFQRLNCMPEYQQRLRLLIYRYWDMFLIKRFLLVNGSFKAYYRRSKQLDRMILAVPEIANPCPINKNSKSQKIECLLIKKKFWFLLVLFECVRKKIGKK